MARLYRACEKRVLKKQRSRKEVGVRNWFNRNRSKPVHRSQTGDPVHTGPSDLTETVEILRTSMVITIYWIMAFIHVACSSILRTPIIWPLIIQRSTATYVHTSSGDNKVPCDLDGRSKPQNVRVQLTWPCMIICMFVLVHDREHNRGARRHSILTLSTLLTEYLSGTHVRREDGALAVQGGRPVCRH